MAKQPFYHRMEVLFTATEDVSEIANTPTFRAALERFLKRQLGSCVVTDSVQLDGPVNAEAGDPADL
jgi:hypothetical protein